jgi:hypothetical protein
VLDLANGAIEQGRDSVVGELSEQGDVFRQPFPAFGRWIDYAQGRAAMGDAGERSAGALSDFVRGQSFQQFILFGRPAGAKGRQDGRRRTSNFQRSTSNVEVAEAFNRRGAKSADKSRKEFNHKERRDHKEEKEHKTTRPQAERMKLNE